MKTAEEILSKHTGETGIYLTHGMIRGSDALEAMGEYLQQSYASQPMSAEQVEDFNPEKQANIISIANDMFSTSPTVKADGWVRVEDRLPEIIEGKDYSENVFAWCNGQIMIMCRTWVDGEPESGYVWANCYDDIDGEGIWDENYYPTHWQPLQLPSPPITE